MAPAASGKGDAPVVAVVSVVVVAAAGILSLPRAPFLIIAAVFLVFFFSSASFSFLRFSRLFWRSSFSFFFSNLCFLASFFASSSVATGCFSVVTGASGSGVGGAPTSPPSASVVVVGAFISVVVVVVVVAVVSVVVVAFVVVVGGVVSFVAFFLGALLVFSFVALAFSCPVFCRFFSPGSDGSASRFRFRVTYKKSKQVTKITHHTLGSSFFYPL